MYLMKYFDLSQNPKKVFLKFVNPSLKRGFNKTKTSDSFWIPGLSFLTVNTDIFSFMLMFLFNQINFLSKKSKTISQIMTMGIE